MRRLRDSAIVAIMLLGLSGCAGVQQRMGWSEPPYVGDESSDQSPLSRLAFWRRHQTEDNVPSASTSDSSNPSRSPKIAANSIASDDEDRPSLLQRLPLLGRLWKNSDRDGSDIADLPAARYSPAVMNSQTTAFAPPRVPANASAFAPPAAAPAPPSSTNVTVVASLSPPVSGSTDSSPETTPLRENRVEDEPLRELLVDLSGTKPQVDLAAIPARNPAGATAPPATAPTSSDPGYQQGSAPSTLPSLPPPGEDVPPVAVPGSATSTTAPSPPSVSGRGPLISSPAGSGGSTPAPTMPTVGEPVILSGSSQSLVTAAPQVGYVSGGCDVPCGGKCNIHNLCPFKKHKHLVASCSSVVLPSSQSVVSTCDAPCHVKKPCFLKTWLHHKAGCKLKGCKGCKTCISCGEPAVMVSSQGPIVSPQW
jgi:hypothetical protein